MAKSREEIPGCIMREPFKSKMQKLIEKGASQPTGISISDWYYIQRHAQKCSFCLDRFEELAKEARKNSPIEGPTTLRE